VQRALLAIGKTKPIFDPLVSTLGFVLFGRHVLASSHCSSLCKVDFRSELNEQVAYVALAVGIPILVGVRLSLIWL